MDNFDYDLFVIGAGSGGVRACRVAASLGAKVAVAEERYFGGTCVNVGCVPKKLFSYAAHYHDDFADSHGFGWDIQGISFDWRRLVANKDTEISRLNAIYQDILDNNNVDVFEHRAVLKSPHEIEVDGRIVTAKNILIAVGGWPWIPKFSGSEHTISSNEVFSLETLPKSIVVVGGGYIAVEFASIFTRLNCKTSLVYRGDKLLKSFDGDVCDFIAMEMSKNLDLRLNSNVKQITKLDSGLEVELESGEIINTDLVLYATGRKPATANLGLEAAGVTINKKGAIVINDSFQTSADNIYAVGDVIDRVALTPVALAEGEVVVRNLFGKDSHAMTYENIPTAVFCHPNIATVGLTEEQAVAKSIDIDVYLSEVKQLKHTLSGRNERCLIKLIVNQADDKVIGLHLVGPDAGELVQGFAVAINCGATKADFDRTIGIHPSLAEEFVTMRKKRKIAK